MPRDIVLYVLKLEDGCYYVGQSANVHKRIDFHFEARGAVWTKAHPPVALVECKRTKTLNQQEAEDKENYLTLQTMKQYGWRNVRGGWFCNVDETLTARALKAHGLLDLLESFENNSKTICKPLPARRKVTISSVGSCNTTTRIGYYETQLELGSTKKYLKRELSDTTVNRCIIQGLLDGVRCLDEPCEVALVAATSLGLAGFPILKGPNVDLLRHLTNELQERNCSFTFDVVDGRGDELRYRIRAGETI